MTERTNGRMDGRTDGRATSNDALANKYLQCLEYLEHHPSQHQSRYSPAARNELLSFYHVLTSSVRYQSTHALPVKY